MLKSNHDDLIKGNRSEEEKAKIINRMSRILIVSIFLIIFFKSLQKTGKFRIRSIALLICLDLPLWCTLRSLIHDTFAPRDLELSSLIP